ncbi:hypothetical protein KFE25_007250 [Diacronema lutheri]|uniref:Uncharacterized protein n=1 Tax=Diacronema lutheri TaxID=2081491 RepID=A0A8J5X2Y9_DIALT|nr:hypothetical protein KFE25_007250 [Diacronema lutheri]
MARSSEGERSGERGGARARTLACVAIAASVGIALAWSTRATPPPPAAALPPAPAAAPRWRATRGRARERADGAPPPSCERRDAGSADVRGGLGARVSAARAHWRSIAGLVALALGAVRARLGLVAAASTAAGALARAVGFFLGGRDPSMPQHHTATAHNGRRASAHAAARDAFHWARNPRLARRAARAFSEASLAAERPEGADGLVARPAVARALEAYLCGPAGQVLIVTGPEGSGKTTAVRQALASRAGVLPVSLGQTVGVGALYGTLMQTAGLKQDSSHESVADQLVPFLKASATIHRAAHALDFAVAAARPASGHADADAAAPRVEGEWLPCLLVEIEPGTPAQHIAAAFNILKRAAVEQRACRAIGVLARAADAFALPAWALGTDRGAALWIGDMERDEADALLKSAHAGTPVRACRPATREGGANGADGADGRADGGADGGGDDAARQADAASAKLRAQVIDALGTRPATLEHCARLLATCNSAREQERALRALAERHARMASLAVDYLLAPVGSTVLLPDLSSARAFAPRAADFGRLMRQLIATADDAGSATGPNGADVAAPVRALVRCEAASYLPPPCDVLPLLCRPEHDALLYDIGARGYRFNGLAHERAARRRLHKTMAAAAAGALTFTTIPRW